MPTLSVFGFPVHLLVGPVPEGAFPAMNDKYFLASQMAIRLSLFHYMMEADFFAISSSATKSQKELLSSKLEYSYHIKGSVNRPTRYMYPDSVIRFADMLQFVALRAFTFLSRKKKPSLRTKHIYVILPRYPQHARRAQGHS